MCTRKKKATRAHIAAESWFKRARLCLRSLPSDEKKFLTEQNASRAFGEVLPQGVRVMFSELSLVVRIGVHDMRVVFRRAPSECRDSFDNLRSRFANRKATVRRMMFCTQALVAASCACKRSSSIRT